MMQTGNSVEFAYQKMVWMTWGWGFVAVICVGLALEAVFGKEKSVGSTEFGSRGKHLRGRIYKSVAKFGPLKNGSFRFGQHFISKHELKKHALLAGSTGSGKSQLLLSFLKQIELEKALVTDPGFEFTQKFYKSEKDLILNPFDKRSEKWNLFAEIKQKTDIALVAKALLPTASGEEETWRAYARNFLKDILTAQITQKNYSIKALINHINLIDAEETALLLFNQQLASASLFRKGSEKILASVQFVTSQLSQTLELIEDGGNFSIRDWIKDGNGGKIFMPYLANQRVSLESLLPLWISLAITEIINLNPDRSRQIFLIIDELDSLESIDSLHVGLQEGRKFGLSAILAIQSINQLIKKYEKNFGAMLNTINTVAVLKQSGGATAGGNVADAEYWQNFLGNEEIERKEVGISKKGLDVQGKSEHDRIESIVLIKKEELMSLPERQGFCVFSGDIDEEIKASVVRDFKVELQNLENKNNEFVQKEIETARTEEEPTHVVQVEQEAQEEKQQEEDNNTGEYLEDSTENEEIQSYEKFSEEFNSEDGT